MDDSLDKRHIVVIGPMGSGKTTLGLALADAMECDFLDSDTWLVARQGTSGSDIAAMFGVRRLHDLELHAFQDMVLHPAQAVIAAAESVVDNEIGRVLLGESVTIWLDATPDALLSRRRKSDHRRDMSRTELIQLRTSRADALQRCSAIRIDTTTATPNQCLAAAMAALDGVERL